MRMGRGRLLLLLWAGLLPCAVQAGEGEQKFLYGRALKVGELGWACFTRHYDQPHLDAHPRQNVTAMTVLAYRPDREGYDESIVNLEFGFRGVSDPVQLSGGCRPEPDRQGVLSCAIECDGGEFTLRRQGERSVLLDITRDIEMCEDGDSLPGGGLGSDDRRFRLDRTGTEACRTLIWDEEIRAKLIEAARSAN
jgi:hypothetical protein